MKRLRLYLYAMRCALRVGKIQLTAQFREWHICLTHSNDRKRRAACSKNDMVYVANLQKVCDDFNAKVNQLRKGK